MPNGLPNGGQHSFCSQPASHSSQNPVSDSISSWEVELFISKVNDALKGINSRQRAGCAMMVIKTVVNSWSTTYRYANNGGIRLPCIFGCGGRRDELSHYFACDILWTVVCTASKRDQTWLSAGHFQRIGFKEPSSMNLILICLMFKTYHALRKDFSQMIDASVADGDFSDIQSRSLFLARLFASDYGL